MNEPGLTLLESDVPLSRSLLFARQRDFYRRRGLEAWSAERVPQFITNNPFIAEGYAGLVAGFLADCRTQGGSAPLRVLELGAGPGKFACLFLRHLAPRLQDLGLTLDAAVRYRMTDCSEKLLSSWRANPHLDEFVRRGVLEFQLLEAGEEAALQPPGAAAPLVVIANYVFDSLPQDCFVVQDGKLLPVLLTTRAPRAEDPSQPLPPLAGLQLSFQAAAAPQPYGRAAWNQVLEQYRGLPPGTSVLFPCAALAALEELLPRSDGRMLVLAADKGCAHQDTLPLWPGPPAFEWHAPDCFSLMVNFDAIARHFSAAGGEALLPDKRVSNLSVCGFLRGRPGDRFPAARDAWRRLQAGFGPDDLFTLLAWLNAHMEEISVPQILSTLRLTRWDPVALRRLFPALARQARGVTRERHDLRQAVLRTWANHFPVQPEDDQVAFDCGVILLELGFFEDAIPLFRVSQQALGPSAATSYNLGLCALGLGRSSEALAFMVEACEQDPGFEPARLSRLKLEGKS